MASIIKHGKGYRAQVYVQGTRDSSVFRTKREAENWAAARETEIRAESKKTTGEKFTLWDALRKYGEEISPTHRGMRWEQIRLNSFKNDLPVDKPIGHITTDLIGQWRDARLKLVSPGTVLREIGLLSAVFEAARRDWKWIDDNPIHDVRKPRAPDHRDVLITRKQIKTMLITIGYSPRGRITTVSQSVAVAFLLALRTGMRAGEICGLTWERVKSTHCILTVTKTKPRNVPLTKKSTRLLDKMRGYDQTVVFALSPQTLDALFRKYRARANLSGFTFHDSRHTAATWIAARMNSSGIPAQQAVMDMCKIFGWSNVSQALTYYNPKIEDIARRIS